VGDRFGSWVWNGSQWVVSQLQGLVINVQAFTASGMYVPSPGLAYAVVEAVGGGGGGAGVFLPDATKAACGGGGGSGGYSRKLLPGGLVLGGVNVTIGAGGAVSEIVGAAPAGTATTFGGFVVANGGGGGISATTTTWGAGGAGAAKGVGDIAMPGNWGESGFLITTAIGTVGIEAGAGASSFYGGGVRGGGNQGTTQPGPSAQPNTGAGGAGAWQNWVSVATATAGGAGGSGLCAVTEFCIVPSSTGASAGCDGMAPLDQCVGWGPNVWPPPGGFPPGWPGR
jgi:hypothetical protein